VMHTREPTLIPAGDTTPVAPILAGAPATAATERSH